VTRNPTEVAARRDRPLVTFRPKADPRPKTQPRYEDRLRSGLQHPWTRSVRLRGGAAGLGQAGEAVGQEGTTPRGQDKLLGTRPWKNDIMSQ